MLGLPCVSTRCAGADEYIVDGENGFLVDVGDRAGLAEKLKALLGDGKLREDFSKRAMDVSSDFSTENVMALWDKVVLGDV